MSEFGQYSAIIVTILGGVFGVGKALLVAYRKDQETIQKLKNEQFNKEIKELETKFGDFTKSLNNHSIKIVELKGAIEKVYLRYDAQTDSIKSVHTDLKETSKEINAGMKAMNTVVLQLSTDMTIFKTRNATRK